MKRVVFISNQAFSLINFRGTLIKTLIKMGVSVYALAPDFDESLRQQVIALGAKPVDYPMSRTGMNPIADLFCLIKLYLILRKIRPCVALVYCIKPVIYGTIAAWFARVPRRIAMIEGLGFVFTDSGEGFSLGRSILRNVVSLFYRLALRRADAVIFLNKDDIEQFIEANLVDADKAICLGGIGVDLKEWTVSPPVTEPVTFVLVARLLLEKGIVEYAEAAACVKALYPQARFVLLGALDSNPGGFMRSDVEGWVKAGVLEWPGHVFVKPWLERASVFVLPSYREGVPRSTQEAMAMGRPIITTDAPGCRETVIDGVNGFLVPVRNSKALVEKMLCFIRDHALIKKMGVESRKIAEERFDVVQIDQKIICILSNQI